MINKFAEIFENVAHTLVKKRAMTNHGVLNEAFTYAKPTLFRGACGLI